MRNRLFLLVPVLLVAALIAPAAASAGIPEFAPDIKALSISPSRFAALDSGGPVVIDGGAHVRFFVADGTNVDWVVKKEKAGKRVNGKCRPGTPRKKTKKRKSNACTRTLVMPGSFKLIVITGNNDFQFSGRMADKALSPGRYRLVGKSEGKAGRSSWVRFKIFKPSKKKATTKKKTTKIKKAN